MATERDALGDPVDLSNAFAVQFMALVNRHTVALSAMGPEFQTSRVISRNLADDSWGWTEFKFGQWWSVGAGLDADGHRRVLFGARDMVAAFNFAEGPNGREADRIKSPATIDAITWIDGHFYACGGNEFLGRRNGPNDWTYLSLHSDAKASKFDYSHVVGLADNDIYLLQSTDAKTLHHWNGTQIRPIALPSAMVEEGFKPVSLLAAPTGQVFVGGHGGELLIGNANTGFMPLFLPDAENQGSKRAVESMAWFDGSLWAVNSESLLRFVDYKWEPQPFFEDPERPTGFKFIDARDGALLVGSQHKAAVFDGKSWKRVFGSGDPDAWMQLQLLERQFDDMKELLDSARRLRDLVQSSR